MRKISHAPSLIALKRIAQATIDKAIEITTKVIVEKRCVVCTTPFIPSPQPTFLPSPRGEQTHPHKEASFPQKLSLAISQKNSAPGIHRGHPVNTFRSPKATQPASNWHQLFVNSLSSWDEAVTSGFFCEDCSRSLPRLTTGFCPLCGELSPWPLAPQSLCLSCLTHHPPWESALFHAPYEGLLRAMLLDHKFSGLLPFGYALGRLLAQHPSLNSLPFDTIIPVPLHPQRLQQRGYNQSMEIAKGIHSYVRHRGIKLLGNHLQRSLPTRPQMGLSHAERQKNVRGVFTLNKPCRNLHILLVDDVYTTGSTLRECTMVLKKNGAASVHIATLARTRRQRLSV